MLALLYLCIAVFFGDILSRRFLSYHSLPHRIAVAFLTGIVISSCITYPAALLFAGFQQPLFWANLLFLGFVIVATVIILRFPIRSDELPPRPPGKWQFDAIVLAACMILGCWLMFSTLDFETGSFTFAIKSWSDFGPNLSLAQSLAMGNNYPTVHPFFPTELARYHFLFWFLSANLSYLGMNLAWAINVLSLLSLLSLLILLMTFAETLFRSRVVGRISVVLFFFASSSLSYIPFLFSQESLTGAVRSIFELRDYLRSGFPYRGDDWGALSVAVFANQRQLLSTIGIALIALIYLIGFYRRRGAIRSLEHELPEAFDGISAGSLLKREFAPMLFCGFLIGLLPYWNTPIFISISLVIGGLFVLLPKREYLAAMIAAIVVIGLPQMLALTVGNSIANYTYFKWGYIVADPTPLKLIEYLLWTFGFKWLLLLLSFFLVPAGHRRVLLALSIPFVVVFSLQLSMEVFNNHKLLNAWAVFISVYIAYALWEIGRKEIFRGVLAVTLALVMTFGAMIDLAPIGNDNQVHVPHNDDALTAWIIENSKPGDIFLTDRYLSHPILFTGRKVFLGNTLFAYTAGYDLPNRERVHVRMLTTPDIGELEVLLEENKIRFIAIDDGVRSNTTYRGLNEPLLRKHYPVVFDDRRRAYGNLTIYQVY